MALQGIVNLSKVPFKALVGRRLKDDFSEEGLVFSLAHGEPVVKVSPCDSIWGNGDPESGRRVRVWAPNLDLVAWVWQSASDGTAMINWLPFDHTDDAGNTKQALSLVRVIAAKAKLESSERFQSFLPQAAQKLFSSRAPRDIAGFRSEGDILVKRDKDGVSGCQVSLLDDLQHAFIISADDVDEFRAPLEVFVEFRKQLIPSSILLRATEALDALAMEGESAKPGSEISILFGVAAQQRDRVWRDFIDPELCLARQQKEAKGHNQCLSLNTTDTVSNSDYSSANDAEYDWQTADAEVDENGQVRWLSWVNHVDGLRHSALLCVLADLLQLSLPQLEQVSGHRLHSRHIQVVPRAYEQVLYGEDPLYKVAQWHTDGYPHERIVATAACYVKMDSTLFGGPVDVASGADAWEDDPSTMTTVLPEQGAVLAFNNAMLRHRVGPLGGAGQRRLIAFHLVDPDYCQVPRAMHLPRQLRSQERLAILRTLASLMLPSRCKVSIAHFAAGGLSAVDILRLRDEERSRKARPMRRSSRDHSYSCCTTISRETSEGVDSGTWFRIARG